MTEFLYSNFAESALTGTIGASDTEINISASDAADFPAPGTGQAFRAVIFDGDNEPEIIEVGSGGNPGTGVLTVTRAKESTVGVAWQAGAKIRLTITAVPLQRALSRAAAGPFYTASVAYASGVYTLTYSDLTDVPDDGQQFGFFVPAGGGAVGATDIVLTDGTTPQSARDLLKTGAAELATGDTVAGDYIVAVYDEDNDNFQLIGKTVA